MALDRFSYPVVEQVKELTQRGNLFYFDRYMAEVNTRELVVTPSLRFEDTVITLPTFSTSLRKNIEVPINRIGSLSTFEVTPVAGVQWFFHEVLIRPLQLGVGLLPRGARQQFPGRSDDVTTHLFFELKPFSIPEDARLECIITKRLYIDLETGSQSVTPVLIFVDGTTQVLSPITQATRAVADIALLASERVEALRLDGDFTHPDIVVYDVEMDMYIPGNVALGAA